MSDQGKWFKLWCSSLTDSSLCNLPNEDWARWAKLGAYIKMHGTDGKLVVEAPAMMLQHLFQVTSFESVISALKRFPNCKVGERSTTVTGVTNSIVTVDVEYLNWSKYQGDYSNDRVKKFRDKKRHAVTAQEEKRSRREEKRRETPPSPDGEVRNLIDLFHLKLTEALGETPPHFNGGSLGRILKAALQTHPVDDVKGRIESWFRSTDPFIVSNGYSPTLFGSRFSQLKGGPIHVQSVIRNNRPANAFVAGSAESSKYDG